MPNVIKLSKFFKLLTEKQKIEMDKISIGSRVLIKANNGTKIIGIVDGFEETEIIININKSLFAINGEYVLDLKAI